MPRGTDTPGVEEFPWGEETSGVNLKGNGVPGADIQGRGGDGNSPATRDTEGSSNLSRGEEVASRQEPAAPPSPHRGTTEVEIGEVSTERHPDGARPKHSALARREYGLLAPAEPAGNPAAAGPQGIRDSPNDTTGTGGTYRRETGAEERNRQRVLLASS